MKLPKLSEAALLARFHRVHSAGIGQWKACCPAHEDRTPSLAIKDAGDRWLVRCHAGCEYAAILAAAGIDPKEMSDWSGDEGKAMDWDSPIDPGKSKKTSSKSKQLDIDAVYSYSDASGNEVFQVVRMKPKDFRQRVKDPSAKNGFRWSTSELAWLPVYRLPAVAEAIRSGVEVHIAEGEKDAETLAGFGMVATTLAGGAKKWRDEYADQLRGADLVVWPDNDAAGLEHAAMLVEKLGGICKSIQVVQMPGKDKADPEWQKDCSDLFKNRGEDLADYGRDHATPAARWMESMGISLPEKAAEEVKAPDLKDPLFPAPILAGDWCLDTAPTPPKPILSGALDASSKFVIVGPSKAKKTWFSMQMALSIAAGRRFLLWDVPAPCKVLLVNFEIKEFSLHQRLGRVANAMGVGREDMNRLGIYNARGRASDFLKMTKAGGVSAAWGNGFVEMVKQQGFEVVLFDPFYKLASAGDESKPEDVKPVLSCLDQLAENTGAATGFVHHTPKGKSGDRDTIDRAAGSGVIARDFDSCFTLTDHEDGEKTVLEATLRDHRQPAPQTIRWDAGTFLFEIDSAEAKVKTSARPASRKIVVDTETARKMALDLVDLGPMAAGEFKQQFSELFGIGINKAGEIVAGLVEDGSIAIWREGYQGKWWYGKPDQIPKHHARGD